MESVFLLNSRYHPADTKQAIASPEKKLYEYDLLIIRNPIIVIKGEQANNNLVSKVSCKYKRTTKKTRKLKIRGKNNITNKKIELIIFPDEKVGLISKAFCKKIME